LRPRDTGWFASFGTLTKTQSSVAYAEGSARFYGATFDPTALYRMNAVLDLLEREALDASRIRAHVRPIQERFARESPLSQKDLVVPISDERRGQFLTFRTPDAGKIQKTLEAANIITDARGDRLRFGFGIYHDEEDVTRGVERIKRALG
jgi:selenocysteine lyase/cysteine desulfurase